MSNKPEDNDIDKLFRDSVDNMETEPSDRFWNRAYESILKNENEGYERRIMIWRGVAVILALVVTGLIAYNVYTNKKVSTIEEQIASIQQKQLPANSLQPSNTASAPAGKTAAVNTAANNTPTAAKQEERSPVRNATVLLGYTKSALLSGNAITNNYEAGRSRHHAKGNLAYANGQPQYDRSSIHNIIYLDEKEASEITMPETSPKADPALYALNVSDSLYMVPFGPPLPAQAQQHTLSKLSVSAYGAPSFSKQTVKDNNPGDNVTVSNIPANEQQQSGYAFGINVGYDLSKNVTLETGLSYRRYKYSISPTTVDVTAGEWEEGYSFATSSGTVYMPYIPGYTTSGYDTSATASGRINRAYVTVPVKLNYNLLHSPTFGIYVSLGSYINILAYNYAAVHCENAWGQEDVYMFNMEGTRRVSLSYLIGVGAKLKLGHGFEVYIEPSYIGALTPNIKSSAMTLFTRYTDYTGGLVYHF